MAHTTYKVAQEGPSEEAQDQQQQQQYYAEQQLGTDFDYSQMLADSIPQLQAQLQQINVMLNNPSLPRHVRQQTEMKHQQLQMELERAQLAATFIQVNQAAAGAMQYANMQQMQQQQQAWTNPYTSQQPAGADSAYQRLPLNNRRRNLKRERPSDFLEVGGSEAKVQRYWE